MKKKIILWVIFLFCSVGLFSEEFTRDYPFSAYLSSPNYPLTSRIYNDIELFRNAFYLELVDLPYEKFEETILRNLFQWTAREYYIVPDYKQFEAKCGRNLYNRIVEVFSKEMWPDLVDGLITYTFDLID